MFDCFVNQLLFEFAEMRGKLLIAKSTRGQEGRRLKEFFLSQRTSKQSLKHKRFVAKGCLNNLFVNLVLSSFVHSHNENFYK